jgi:hypothetical protein
MTRDKAERELDQLEYLAREMFNGFEAYKPMHMHMHRRAGDFLVREPSKSLPNWAWYELKGYVDGLMQATQKSMRFAYEFEDGRVLPIDSHAYKEIERPDGSGSKWISDNWVACGFVWPEPNYLGRYSWFTYTTRDEHEREQAARIASYKLKVRGGQE